MTQDITAAVSRVICPGYLRISSGPCPGYSGRANVKNEVVDDEAGEVYKHKTAHKYI